MDQEYFIWNLRKKKRVISVSVWRIHGHKVYKDNVMGIFHELSYWRMVDPILQHPVWIDGFKDEGIVLEGL